MYDESSPYDRIGLDLFHFAIGFAGFIFAAGGVVISSVCVVGCGLLGLAWSIAYFAVNKSED